MQFLPNENFALDAVEAVRKIGHDVAWIRTDAPGSKDRDILKRAASEQRILLTFDKDFGDLAFQFGLPAPCGIVLSSTNGAGCIRRRKHLTRRSPRFGKLSTTWPRATAAFRSMSSTATFGNGTTCRPRQ